MMSVTTFYVIGGAGTRKPLGLEFTRTRNKTGEDNNGPRTWVDAIW